MDDYKRFICRNHSVPLIFQRALLVEVGDLVVCACPDCYSRNIKQITVCVECLEREPVFRDDLCQPCLALENDKAADMILEESERNAA